jgi:hypothetical protein
MLLAGARLARSAVCWWGRPLLARLLDQDYDDCDVRF